MRKLLIVLVVLGALVVAGDRIAAKVAADQAEKRLVREGFTDPSVGVHGFPFVTQLLSRDFDEVTLQAASLRRATSRGVTAQADSVTATMRGVTAPSNADVHVRTAVVSGTIRYDVIEAAVGLSSFQLSKGSGDEVRVRREVRVLAKNYTVAGRGRIEAQGTRLRIVPTNVVVEGSGPVDDAVTRLLGDRLTVSYRIPNLPEGVRVDKVTAVAEGLRVDASGRDVVLPRKR